MMTWLGRVAACLGVAGMILASAPPLRAAEILTALGPVTIDAVPRTVAVYDIAAIDTLARLGVKPDGLPMKLYVPALEPLAKGTTPVGTIFEPDLEALSALAPDLIIVGSRSAPRLDSVRRVAPAIDMTLDGRNLLAEARQRLIAYGLLFGRQAEAETAAAELDTLIQDTRAAAEGKGKALIVMTNGPKLSVYGVGSRFGWIHSELGLPPAVQSLETAIHGEVISFEFIRRADPDWLIVLDRTAAVGEAGSSAGATLDNELVAQTAAGKKGRIVHLPPPEFYVAAGGIPSTMRVLERIRDAFQAAK